MLKTGKEGTNDPVRNIHVDAQHRVILNFANIYDADMEIQFQLY